MEEAVGSPKDGRFTLFSDAVPIHTDSSILSVEVIENIESAVRRGQWVEVVSLVKEITQKVSRTTVSIAVTGDSGNGMSSFINALRNIGHEEEDSAPTGVVRTTQTPACYSYSNFPSVDLWDLPGTGVTAQSVESYMDEMQFSLYDFIIIIASEQFSLNHVKLAEALQEMRKRFCVVWTKLDRDLSTSALPEPQLLQSIQRNIQENLQKVGVKEPPIFLVSTLDPSAHDFPKLRKMLQEDIFNIRYCGLSKTLFQICEKTINEKVDSINKGIDADNLQAFGIQDPGNLIESEEVYQKIFGVDEDSLRQVALSMKKPDTDYKNIIQQQDGWTLSWIYQSTTQCLGYIPSCHPYARRYRQQDTLNKVVERTKKFLWKILKDSVILPSEGTDN